MRKLTKYQCEICGAVYDTEAEAQKCDLTHVRITGMEVGFYAHAAVYPSRIDVEMQDGKQISYTRSE